MITETAINNTSPLAVFGWLCGMYDPLQPLGKNVKDYLCCLLDDNPELDIEF